MIICRIRGFQSALMAIWIELSWLRYTLVVFLFQIVVSTDCVLSLWVSRKSNLKIATLFFDYNTPTLINIIRSPMVLMNSTVEISFLVILMWFYTFFDTICFTTLMYDGRAFIRTTLYYAMWTAVQFNQFWSIRRCSKLSCCSIHNLLACSFICLWKLWNDTLLALGSLQIKRLIILLFTSGTNCVPLRVNKHRSAALDACMYCSLHSICVTMWAV